MFSFAETDAWSSFLTDYPDTPVKDISQNEAIPKIKLQTASGVSITA